MQADSIVSACQNQDLGGTFKPIPNIKNRGREREWELCIESHKIVASYAYKLPNPQIKFLQYLNTF